MSESQRLTEVDALVVGGGIAGLSAALEFLRRGIRFLLVESSGRLGGVVRTERAEGFLMEAGPDALLTQKPAAVALCRELGLGDRLLPTNPTHKTVYVLVRGKLHPLPEGMMLGVPTRLWPMVTTGLFSWPAKLRMATELRTRPRPNLPDESIASFLRRHFGDEAVERLGEPLLAGIHAGDPERLSMLSAFPRFVEMERRHGSLIRALWKSGARQMGGSAFVSLPGGLQEMVDAAVSRLPAGSLRTHWPGAAARRHARAWEVQGPAGEVVRAASVILALPPAAAARILASLDVGLSEALAAIPSVSTAVAYLAYRRAEVAHPLDGYGIVVPRTEGLRTSALSFVSTKFPGRAPEGYVLLRGFLGGARDPQALDRDDDALADRTHAEFAPLLGLRSAPVFTRVFRWPQATPQMEVGHGAKVEAIEKLLALHPGLLLTGAGLRGTGIPDMVADGALQAGRVNASVLSGGEQGSLGTGLLPSRLQRPDRD